MHSIAKAVFAAVLSVVLLYAMYSLRQAALMLYVAIVLAVLFDPAVELVRRVRIRRYRPSRGAATAIVTVLTAGVIALIAFAVVPPVRAEAAQLERDWPQRSARMFEQLHRTLPFSRSITPETAADWLHKLVGKSPVLTLGTTAMDVLATLLLGIYLLADGPKVFAWMLSLAPEDTQPKLDRTLRAAADRMQGWVAGQGILMLTHGGSALVTFWLIGLPYFLPLAVFAAVINIIPVLGPILTLGAAGLVALIASPGKLVGVIVFYLVYHNVEGIYLQPRIMSAAVGISGAAIVAALMIGDELAGFVGMALSVPTAVLLAEIKQHYVPRRDGAGTSVAH